MNGQTDTRAQLMVGIGAAIFSAIQKITAGQPAARVVIGAAHDILDVAGHDHTFDAGNPLRAAVEQAAASRGPDGLTDQERAGGMTAASVLGENDSPGASVDRSEETLPVAGAAAGEGGGSDFTLPADVTDRRVPGDYIAPDSSRPTDGDAERNAAAIRAEEDARERFNLSEAERADRLQAVLDGGRVQEQDAADGGRVQEQAPDDGGKVQEQDPADGGRVQEQAPGDGGRIQGAHDAPQQ